jgi:hypothetical protein
MSMELGKSTPAVAEPTMVPCSPALFACTSANASAKTSTSTVCRPRPGDTVKRTVPSKKFPFPTALAGLDFDRHLIAATLLNDG